MPIARVNINVVRKELQSLPGGFVELKAMSYGDKLRRMELATETTGDEETEQMVMKMMQKRVTAFEFKRCVVNHNLEYAEGQPFDLTNQAMLDELDSKVGDEIATLIDKMNNFEATDNEASSDSLKVESDE